MSAELLSQLAPGEKARISGFNLPGESLSRLFEMGLTNGAAVELVRFAPLGDPIDIKVRGYHLSLRKREAAGIQIERI
ncbi:MAG: ferrous iron transport protein A [Chthoniobacteraceae bacterium]